MNAISDQFRAIAKERGDSPFLTLLFSGREAERYSYAELMEEAERWSAAMNDIGL